MPKRLGQCQRKPGSFYRWCDFSGPAKTYGRTIRVDGGWLLQTDLALTFAHEYINVLARARSTQKPRIALKTKPHVIE